MSKNTFSWAIGLILASAMTLACSSEDADEHSDSQTAASALSTCDHSVCSTGASLSNTCDSCTAKLCALDSYCCNVTWDATCVGEVKSICGNKCKSSSQGEDSDSNSNATSCSHSTCKSGSALVSGCEPCSAKVCALDPYCCNVAWDGTCVSEVASICGTSCDD